MTEIRWALDLDSLVTHPDYRRRGFGARLVKCGCDLADKYGVGLYVEAREGCRAVIREVWVRRRKRPWGGPVRFDGPEGSMTTSCI